MQISLFHKFSSMLRLVSSTLKQAIDERSREFPLKIVDKIFCSKKQQDYLIIQVPGKAIFFKKFPSELVIDDALLGGFSPFDSRLITFLALQEKYRPEEKIVATEYSPLNDDILLHTKNRRTKSTDLINAVEISKNKELLNKFGTEDAHRIGYLLGTKSAIPNYKTQE